MEHMVYAYSGVGLQNSHDAAWPPNCKILAAGSLVLRTSRPEPNRGPSMDTCRCITLHGGKSTNDHWTLIMPRISASKIASRGVSLTTLARLAARDRASPSVRRAYIY